MRFLNNFLQKTKKQKSKALADIPSEIKKLYAFKNAIDILLSKNVYIAKRDYINIIENFSETYRQFHIIRKSSLLEDYCRKNQVDMHVILKALKTFDNIEFIVDEHNTKFIEKAMLSEKDFLDNMLSEIDPSIKLDEDQRKVVLTDEDYCLVIAGAGAGKTTTIAAKVKYLVDKKHVDPKQILVISFTNKAVDELRDRINKSLSIPCPITTFHSAGNAIIRKQNDQRLNIVDSGKMYCVIMDYFKGSLLRNARMVNNLILFFGSYFDAPYEGDDLNAFFESVAKANYSTLKSDLNEFIQEICDTRSKKHVTIANEVLRSRQEVEIANFLYLNDIDYQYEPLYPYNIQFSRKPYTPDFIIRQDGRIAYIEHFGISESGKNSRFSPDEIEEYKKSIRHKIEIHKQHGTTLIYTFSSYNDGRPITEHLKEQLEAYGFVLHPRSSQEIIEKLVTHEESRYIRKLVDLVCRFITNFKTNAYTLSDFSRMSNSTKNVRTKLFLDICQECYLQYQKYLAENNAVDFQDMINESVQILKKVKEMKQKLDFKYIIVDEYQDISRQRFDLTKELSTVTDAKIIAVGDDWQSIYAFSGSDITLFTEFISKMGYGKLLKIEKTYRNAQEIINIAGGFIQKNTSQIKKTLISPKHISDPVIIYTYDPTLKREGMDNKSGVNYAIAHTVEAALEQIMAYDRIEREGRSSKILLLGRFGFDGYSLERSGLFEYINREGKVRSVKYPHLDITFMTAHSSKGLGYDNVIVINGRNYTYGFPAKIQDDPVLKFVIKDDKSIEFAEERWLFYVAITRTKNRVYFIAPEQNPSEFLLEIKHDYQNVVLRGKWEENFRQPFFSKNCPICGYPLQYRYKNAYGLRLYICTNEPEICGFLTNDLTGRKMSIQKCEKCIDGYLIIKKSDKSSIPFLGCTNYKQDGKGCNNTITKQTYYSMYGLKDDNENTPDKLSRQNSKSYKAEKPTESQSTKEKDPVASGVREIHNVYSVKTINLTHKNYSGEAMSNNALKHIKFNHNDMPTADLMHIVGTILQSVIEISKKHFFGTEVLLNVLRGSTCQKVKKYKLNESVTYGSLAGIDREVLRSIIDWLILNRFLYKREGRYPVLHITYNGNHFEEFMTDALFKDLAKSITNRDIL